MKATKTTPKAYGYIRVSTGEQADSGAGLDAQRHTIEGYAAKSGLPLVEVFSDEGISGAAGIEDRAGLAAAIGALRRGDVLIVAKRDRLGRDVMLVGMIDRMIGKRGAAIVSADGVGNGTGAADQFMRTVMDAAAEFERGLIRARTKAAMGAMRRSGRLTGTVPFGWTADADGNLHEVPEEQEVITRIVALRAEGTSLRRIAAILDAAGRKTKTGKRWYGETVRSILDRRDAVAA
jgi:DNA invertase Pin-like site-specific DNA recombinase